MGRVAAAYGVRGWEEAAPQGGAADGLAGAKGGCSGAQGLAGDASRIPGATVVGKLAGIERREQALGFKGRTVAVRREALPEPEEGRYYLADLIGLEVVNEQGEALGVVKRAYWNGAQDVIEVAGDRTRLIPWVAAVVRKVDLSNKQVDVDWGADW